jgi:hypothetical protein
MTEGRTHKPSATSDRLNAVKQPGKVSLGPQPAPHPLLTLQRMIGNQAVLGLLRRQSASTISNAAVSAPAVLQRKLIVGAVDDPLEHEADRVAEQVMRMPDFAPLPTPKQLYCKCDTCQEEEKSKTIRTTPASAAVVGGTVVPDIVDGVLASPGQPLDTAARRFFEPRLGVGLGDVRVHTGDVASQSARAVDARAYAVGGHIVFAAGAYAPDTHSGRELLAHELVHTIQQGAGNGALQSPLQRRGPGMHDEGMPFGRGTLPYREAKDLADCMRIMGPDSADYCRQEVLHEPPAPGLSAGDLLGIELQTIIDGAIWGEIRKRVYPLESAAGIKRARDRHALLQPDLTGLGRLKTLDHFAVQIRDLQTRWPSFATADDRVKEVGKATNAELKSADVPEFLALDKQPMEFKGFFSPSEWKFVISRELVSGSLLPDKDAGELANTALHESRHAEQHFLAARFSAGIDKKHSAAIRTEQNIPAVIADAAVAKKFDARTDAETLSLGKRMFKATVTDRAPNQTISDDDGLADLKKKREDAVKALGEMRRSETLATVANAKAKRDALKAQIADVERRYKLYRDIPYEADAHEVGDAAEQAFKGWQ